MPCETLKLQALNLQTAMKNDIMTMANSIKEN